jgi:hypothetical protein
MRDRPLTTKKQFVLLIVVPDELSQKLGQLDVLTVRLARDPELPAVIEQRQFALDVYFVYVVCAYLVSSGLSTKSLR